MNKHIRRVRTISARFRVGQHVRISKEKMKFKEAPKKILIGKYFELTRILENTQAVYELEDLNKTPIEGQFYQEELTPVRITKQSII